MPADVRRKLFTVDDYYHMAEAGILSPAVPEAWIADLTNDMLLVFRHPANTQYNSELTLHRGDSISVIAFPEIILNAGVLLG